MASSQQQRDFLDEVQGYLDRGEVFKPAEDFVQKLSLCQRCRGGASQREVLKDTISRMASLVQDKLETQRNKKILQGWLKTVAKDLDTFQIVSRDWIQNHIWKLPDLPKLKEQDYDPMKGRRDIRFYPASEAKEAALLSMTEQEEMEPELDYVDEDRLLSVSPRQTTNKSPRRSPRFSKPPSATSATSTSQSPVRTPRRSPRVTKAQQQQETSRKGQQEPARKVSVSKAPAATLAVTCSSAREPRQQWRTRKDEGLAETGGQRKRKTSLAHRDTGIKQARSGHSTESRQRDDSRACSSLSAAAPTSVGRQVTVQKKASHQPEQSGASSHTEELVISTSFLTKTKMDDIIQTVQQKVKERRHPEVKKPKKMIRCWVPGCIGDARYSKAHAFYDHLPSIFDERLEPTSEEVLCGRRNALKQAGRWLLGRPVELDELVAFVTVQKLLSQTDNTEVTQRQEVAMQEFCKFLHEPIPEKFLLEPCSSIGALLHWKALLLIAASLTEEERGYWRKNFCAPEENVQAPVIQQRRIPEAFDSHFHLDRTLRDMFLPASGSVDDILQQAPMEEEKRISLVGGVVIYCDPDTYPSQRFLDRLPEHISVGIGFHPKHASNTHTRIEDGFHQLRRLLRHPRVVALGEVGLDHSVPMRYWAYQVELLEKVLPCLEDRHVLVIHCRGMKGDCGTEAFLLLLHYLKKHVRPNQPIHLHCFTGNSYVVGRWLEVFPRTYFGFTNRVSTFNRFQIEALCSIDENRLLLESDAPYFPIEGETVSSPSQLYVWAEIMARHRQLTVERMLEITLTNARHLYQGQQ